MSVTQSLSDIQTMLKYIEGLLTNKNTDEQTEHLSSIGQNTMDIINHIKTMNETLLTINDNVLSKHEEIIEHASLLTKESLDALIRKIEENESAQKVIFEDVQAIYTRYEESAAQILSVMTDNAKGQAETTVDLSRSIKEVSQNINSMNEKLLSKNDIASMLDEINNQLGVIINTDAENVRSNQASLEAINNTLLETKELIESSSGTLQSIQDMYTESTSRLSVIDTKMDAMTKYVMGGD